MRRIQLSIDGRTVEVLAQKISGSLWFHFEGETYQYTPESKQAQVGGAGALQDPTQIIAPMPGKIIKIHKNQNDKVEEGDTIISMEAMKMEYNLKATQDMKISDVNCSEGDTVSLGQLLVKLEEEDV